MKGVPSLEEKKNADSSYSFCIKAIEVKQVIEKFYIFEDKNTFIFVYKM